MSKFEKIRRGACPKTLLEACILWALAWVPLAPNRLHLPYDLLPKNILRRLCYLEF